MNDNQTNKLSLLGGTAAVSNEQEDMFKWPIVTEAHEKAVLEVLRAGQMSGVEVTKQFERKFADWVGMKYALGCPNGTSAILEGLYALGVQKGDEVICPSITFWASVVQLYTLRATPVFADIDPQTLNIDPIDIERRISGRTKAIVVVHYSGMPADMDAIMTIAEKHNLKVLEDCAHAHGSLYKGKPVGTFGDAAMFSVMTGKSFAVGEGGLLLTDDREVYEKALLWGHYIRHNELTIDGIKEYGGLPCGGVKNRMHQLTSAMGVVQVDHYPAQMKEIDKAMNYFCDGLDGLEAIIPIRPKEGSSSTKGGWYFPLFHYDREKLGGLSIKRFCDALRAEGTTAAPGCNKPLHLHPLFTAMDIFNDGKPTRIANLKDAEDFEVNQSLPVSEGINKKVIQVPWFKHFRKDIIDEHITAFKKVVCGFEGLLDGDLEQTDDLGGYSSFFKNN
jgi:perosamine synthetase